MSKKKEDYLNRVDQVNKNYMNSLIDRNEGLIQAAIELHQSGQLPPNTYLYDLDAHRTNARLISEEARKHKVSLYYMAKQAARDPLLSKAILGEGFLGIVAVDVQEAYSLFRYGLKISHVGHLVQIPIHDIEFVMSCMKPEVWTVYSVANAKAISNIAKKLGTTQDLLIQPIGKDDVIFDIMTGGIPEERIVEGVNEINSLPGVRVVGTTNFPCLVYDVGLNKVVPNPNFGSAVRSARRIEEELGTQIKQVNVAPNCHAATMRTIAENGGTHGEPGAGVSGANTWQAFERQPEVPGVAYVTEVSHLKNERLYAQGGGLAFPGGGFGRFPDGTLWHGGEDLPMDALVGSSLTSALNNRVEAKSPGTDPFCYNLTLFHGDRGFNVGDTVVYGFNDPQVFTTRAWHAVVAGIQENDPRLLAIFDQGNNLVNRHGNLLGERAVIELLTKI